MMRAALLLLAACGAAAPPGTTDGAIALANLDQLIAQRGDAPGVEELLLARARFLGDDDALDRAVALAEARPCLTADDHLRRARARSAVHRFADALADLAALRTPAADELRASILVATGRAREALPALIARARRPTYGALSALATARGALGDFAEADRLYAAALDQLDTTSPFPYAWTELARGILWAEQAHDAGRGERHYRRALAYLPQLATARIHLAELEAARGEVAAAIARVAPVAAAGEPEALGLLAELHTGTRRALARVAATARFEALLARHPLAFADHAAEFYLRHDAARALALARQNLAARPTQRACALVVRAVLRN